MNLKSKY